MSIFEKNRFLYGKNVKVTYKNGIVVTGFWSDWFFIDDNAYLAEFGDDPCESIVLDRADASWGTLTEVLETEIVKIEEA